MTPRTPHDDQRIWTVLELLQWTTAHFKDRGIASARLDAECLLAYALGCDRLKLYVDYEKPVEEAERGRFRELVKARGGERMPVAYLTGRREFWSLPLAVSPAVLVPRPETECLVEAAMPLVGSGTRVLEVGTGSGAIVVALATEHPDAVFWATDLSSDALSVAQKNAQALVPEVEIRWLEGDLFAPLGDERFDLIVSNPPYVDEASREGLPPELAHEPAGALFGGGDDGAECLRRLVAGAPAHLRPGGRLLLELDPRQIPELRRAAVAAGFDPGAPIRDAAGTERALLFGLPDDPESATQPTPLEPS